MVNAVAQEMHLPPDVVWSMDPRDLATQVDLLVEKSEEMKRASRRRR